MTLANYRRPVAFAFLGIAALAALRMYHLQADERLWGVWPLLLLLAAWFGLVLLRQHPGRLPMLGWSSVAGVSLGLSFAPYGAIWSPIFGFAILLGVLARLDRAGASKRQVLWYAYHTMVVFNVVATWWVANTAIAAGIVANFLNALFMAVVALLIFLVRRHRRRAWLAGAVCLWVGFEYLHFNWQIAWPWLCLGHTFAPAPVLAQWFSVTGVFGGSLYVTVSACLVYRVFASRDEAGSEFEVSPIYRNAARAAVAILVPLAVSVVMYAYAKTSGTQMVIVAAVQPNLEPHYQKFRVAEREQLERFRTLTERALAANAQLVIYPETSFSGIDEALVQAEPWVGMWDALAAEAAPLAPALLTGLSSYARLATDNGDPAVRTQSAGAETVHYIAHNSASVLDGGGPVVFYNKSKLVPGVEFLPYRKVFFFFEPLVASLGGTTAGLGRNDSAAVFRLRSGVVAAPLICYESIYGDYVRQFVKRGANLLVVPTNDGWWDESPGYRQHFNLARLRAIETRRWVVQAANSGTSGIIDERGRAIVSTNYDEATTLTGGVALLDGETIYVRFGDVIGWVLAGGACLTLLGLSAALWRAR